MSRNLCRLSHTGIGRNKVICIRWCDPLTSEHLQSGCAIDEGLYFLRHSFISECYSIYETFDSTLLRDVLYHFFTPFAQAQRPDLQARSGNHYQFDRLVIVGVFTARRFCRLLHCVSVNNSLDSTREGIRRANVTRLTHVSWS